jgi:hypothetical protein
VTISELRNAMYKDSFYNNIESVLTKRLNDLSLELSHSNDTILNEITITTLAIYGLKKLKENVK